MSERLEALLAALVVSGTVWLTLGLAAAWRLRRRPARAHGLLTLAAAGSLATPLLVVAVQQANWGVLPAVPAHEPAHILTPVTVNRPPDLAAASFPRELHPALPPHARPERESSARIPEVAIRPSPPPISPPAAPELPWRAVAFSAWLTISAALGLRLLADVAAGWRTVRRSQPMGEADAALVRALRNAAVRIDAPRPEPRLRRSRAVASPALWGWSRPATILIPETTTLPGDCEAVFCHELAHLRRRDHWTALLAELLVCVLPWQPLAWVTRRWMGDCAEEACDDWAVACGCPPLDYAESLVGLVPTATPTLTVAAVSRRSPLAMRVRRLLSGGFGSPRLGRGWIAGATFGALLLAAAWALWQPRHAGADPLPGDDPPKAATSKEAAQPAEAKRIRVVVLDPEGEPIPDANVHASIWTEEKGVRANRDYKTNAAGGAEVELPKTFNILRLWASKAPFVSMFANWEQAELASGRGVPAKYTFRLESAVTVGGRILNERGEPIPGAKVMVEMGDDLRPAKGDGRMRYDSHLAERSDPATTDAEGRWRIDNVPDHPQLALSLLVSHPDYLSDEFWGEAQKAAGITAAMLRQGTATLTLKPGVIVRGRVTDPAGKPIEDALIVHGDDPYFASKTTEFPTDAEGRYRLPALAPPETTLTVVAPGWAPQMRRVNLQAELPPQDFHMEPGKPIRLRIVDAVGKAIPEAYISLREWKGKKSLHNHDHPNVHDTKIPRRSDGDGLWEWTWAPDEPVKLSVGLKGFAPAEFAIGGGEPTRTVVLKGEHRITGRVTDAVTGKPIPAFRVVPIDVFRKDFLNAERYNSVAGKEGRLNYRATRTDIPLRLRVEAEGYRTQDGPEFRVGDDASLTQDFRLRPSPPISGTVVDASGQPVAKAEVLLATPTQEARPSSSSRDMAGHKSITDASGIFTFPDPGEPWAVIAQSDPGYALAEFPADRHDAGTLRLRPWASVRGQFRDGGQPVRGAWIFLQPIRLDGLGPPRIEGLIQTVTDADGRFEFPRVPPGPVNVRAHLGPWKDQGFRSGPSQPLDLQPGQRAELDLGSSGTTVNGKVTLTGNVPADLDCTYSVNYLVSRAPVMAPPPEIAGLGFDIRKGWRHTWTKTSEGLTYLTTLPHWFVKLAPDGTFRISGVPAGEYDLAFEVYAKPSGCLVDPLAQKVVRVTVTAADAARGEMTLPEVAAEVVPVPAVGDTPALAFPRADRGDGTLEDYRGRYTVVHFWASWCGPCKQQLPALRRLQEQHAGRGLAMLGLSLDEDAGAWKAALERLDLPWTQGRLAAPGAAGVSSVPAYWLLDPAGKIVAKATDPDELAAPLLKSLANIQK
jgi:beta-lactamase regulating signal transducer with metallopeptidase domain/protocatechuate 3,4-dioxygenase beta subunit/thiol-disulfide isomerase/thioredoxin